jgi:hypothetical protein
VNDAEQRAWEVVRRAFDERRPSPPRRSLRWVVAGAVAVLAAVTTAVLSPPGRAVFERVREAVGVQHADVALFSLPAPGRLLVVSEDGGGVWLVQDNGFKRKIGSYADAQWSPHGLYVVATRANELVTLDPEGAERWTLARRGAAQPRWEGTRTDTRIAYLTPGAVRVVAGDGTGDRRLAASAPVAPAWDPARLHTLAYATPARDVVLRRVDDGHVVWRRATGNAPAALTWSSDGRLLAAVAPRRIVVLSAAGRVVRTVSTLTGAISGAAFEPGTHRLALTLRHPDRSEVKVIDVDRPGSARLLFAGPGTFRDIAWSPNGRWLLVDWPTANQWVFLHGSRVHAVANIREEFHRADDVVPRLRVTDRWCCG